MQDATTQTVKDEVFQRIDALGEKLGVAAEQLWEVLVTQHTVVNGLFFSAVGVTFLVVGLAAASRIPGSIQEGDKNANEKGDWTGADAVKMVALVLLTVIGVVAGVITTLVNVPHLINPEYYALQDILRIF